MPLRLLFDIETNGLDDASVIHSLVIKDVDAGSVRSYADQLGYAPINEGLTLMEQADVLIGHNILTYDIPTLSRLRPDVKLRGLVRDTLVMARLIWPDLKDADCRLSERDPNFPRRLIGDHTIEAWGYRLKCHKGSFGKQTDWQHWSKDMQDYCEQDVEVNHALLRHIEKQNYSEQSIQLEHDFRWVIHLQERHGWKFDRPAAEALAGQLSRRRAELTAELQAVFPPEKTEMKTPAYWVDAFGNQYPTKGAGQQAKAPGLKPGPNRVKITPFNPGSREQIADQLKAKGWVPTKFTETGRPQVDESVIDTLDFPEAKPLKEITIVNKVLSQLAEGDNGWLKLERNGRIHGAVNTNGCVTGRCSHFKPNTANIPSVMLGKDKKPLHGYEGRWGWECRSLFIADEGFVEVGADGSGLELRCLSHYLARYDGGAYATIVVSGDVHTANQLAAGLQTRADSKTFAYQFLYGAGDELLGLTYYQGKPPSDEDIKLLRNSPEWRAALTKLSRIEKGSGKKQDRSDRRLATISRGARLRRQFIEKTNGLKALNEAVIKAIDEKGYLIGLDGRRLHSRSKHSALNLLLQAAGAILMKQALVFFYQATLERGWVFGTDWGLLGSIHDEYQMQARPAIADEVGKLMVESIRRAGEHFKFRCPLDGEYKKGPSWAYCH